MRPAERIAAAWLVMALSAATAPLPARAQTPAPEPASPPSSNGTLSLAEAVEAALRTHPAVLAATARVRVSEESAEASRARLLPELAVSGALVRHQEPMIVAPLHAFDPARPPVFDRNLVQGGVVARYSVFDGGRARARIDAEEARLGAGGERARAARMDVVAAVVEAFVAVQAATAVLEATEAQVAALDAERARAETSFEAGTSARVAVLRATAALQDALAHRAAARARTGLAERSLARLTGLPTTSVAGGVLAPVSVGAEPTAAPDDVSPRVTTARRSLEAAEAGLAEQRSARLPTIELNAGLYDFGTLGPDHTAEWQAGARISFPVFTGGARRALIRGAAAGVDAARGDLAAAELAVAQEADGARTAVTEADARAEALGAAVDQWTEVARIERLALSAGSGVQRDLLRAEAGLFEARAGLAGARRDAVVARVGLARALGVLDADWVSRTFAEVR